MLTVPSIKKKKKNQIKKYYLFLNLKLVTSRYTYVLQHRLSYLTL